VGLRLLLFVSLVLSATAGVSLAAQLPAMASSCAAIASGNGNLLFHAAGPCYTVPVAHKCEAIGTLGNGNQAVVCSDIYTSYDTTHFEIWGTGQYYCQGPAVQCKGIHAGNTLVITLSLDAIANGNPEPNNPLGSPSYQCSTTSCPNGGHVQLSTGHYGAAKGAGAFCIGAQATIPAGDAILVQGASTAFHPGSAFSASEELCYYGWGGHD
jgi:hypothetical protein